MDYQDSCFWGDGNGKDEDEEGFVKILKESQNYERGEGPSLSPMNNWSPNDFDLGDEGLYDREADLDDVTAVQPLRRGNMEMEMEESLPVGNEMEEGAEFTVLRPVPLNETGIEQQNEIGDVQPEESGIEQRNDSEIKQQNAIGIEQQNEIRIEQQNAIGIEQQNEFRIEQQNAIGIEQHNENGVEQHNDSGIELQNEIGIEQHNDSEPEPQNAIGIEQQIEAGTAEPDTTVVQMPVDGIFFPVGKPITLQISEDGTITICRNPTQEIRDDSDDAPGASDSDVHVLDECLLPLPIWMKACNIAGNDRTYQSGKLLSDHMFSAKEYQQASKSGRNCLSKLCAQKQLAILRAESWMVNRMVGITNYNSRQPLDKVLPAGDVCDLIKRIFTSHRNQQKRKYDQKRTKKPRVSVTPLPIDVLEEYFHAITWAANHSSIPRTTWAEAFIEILKGNLSKAAGILFENLFPPEEQLISSVDGTSEKPGKPATYPLDRKRCNGIVLICRWMLANVCSYPYKFPSLSEQDLIGTISLTTDETKNIWQIFIDRPNQRRQTERKKRMSGEKRPAPETEHDIENDCVPDKKVFRMT